MMDITHSNAAKLFLFISILLVFEFMGSLGETCEKIDDCSCKKSNGKVISLKDIDGGSEGPAFKDIPSIDPIPYKFDWNPCTKFSEGSDCTNMLLCQKSTSDATDTHPCANIVVDFEVDSDGSTIINYQQHTDSGGYKRTVKITLKCDASKYPGEPKGVAEDYQPKNSHYSMTFMSKCACDDGCYIPASESTRLSTELSPGSILLIAFFVLLFVYLIAGIIIKKYKMGVESMPEMVPNYEFWAGIPSLVKDGVVFTCRGLKSGCTSLYQKCSNDGYAKI